MSYSLDRFIKPLLETDKIVTVYNNLNKPVYTINPLSVSRIYVSGNLLKLNLTKNNAVIILDFANANEAKQGLSRLQSQFNLIKNKLIEQEKQKETVINQVQDSFDFSNLYESISTGGTFSGPTSSTSATASNTIEQRLLTFVQKIGTDVANINNKVVKKVNVSYIPMDRFSEESNQHQDVIGVEFDFDSVGDVNIYINSLLVLPSEQENSIAYFSDNGVVKSNIFTGSRLYLNPYLLGYDIDSSDVISIEYLKEFNS